MDVRVGPWRRLSTKELMLSTCGVGKDSWESFEQQQIKPVNPKGNQSWLFIGRTDAEAEATILWPADVKNWLIRKDPDAVKDWRQEENGMTEDEIVGWYHELNGHKFEQASGDGEGQGSLACYSPKGHRVWHDWLIEQHYERECKKEYIYLYICIIGHSALHLKLTQHCKSAILQ